MRPTAHEELDLDGIGAFHVRWYPDSVAGPFQSRAELAEYMRRRELGRPDELLAPFDTKEVGAP